MKRILRHGLLSRLSFTIPLLIVWMLCLAACGSLTPADPAAPSETEQPTETASPDPPAPWVSLPPGMFTMGSPETEIGRDTDEPAHTVTLTRPFEIAAYEVTQAEFEAQLGYQPSIEPDCPACPAEYLSWYEALAYTNALSEESGLAPCYQCEGEGVDVICGLASSWASPYDCEGYRLPTEAEWEYAARSAGTVTSAFPAGSNLVASHDAHDCLGQLTLEDGTSLDDESWYCGNTNGDVREVGQLLPNEIGLFDLSGNVFEWVYDGFGPYDETSEDPVGPAQPPYRVMRGGSAFLGQPQYVRMSFRQYGPPEQREKWTGLRVARTLTD